VNLCRLLELIDDLVSEYNALVKINEKQTLRLGGIDDALDLLRGRRGTGSAGDAPHEPSGTLYHLHDEIAKLRRTHPALFNDFSAAAPRHFPPRAPEIPNGNEVAQ
jgi:hypothetical protein